MDYLYSNLNQVIMKQPILFLSILSMFVFSGCKEKEVITPGNDNTEIKIPTVTTLALTEITVSSAKSGGTISDDGGADVTERGVCYSELPNPNVNNDVVLSGAGVGSFVSEITGLKKEQTYFVRAYATNSAGTAYGDELELKTLGDIDPNPPTFQMIHYVMETWLPYQ